MFTITSSQPGGIVAGVVCVVPFGLAVGHCRDQEPTLKATATAENLDIAASPASALGSITIEDIERGEREVREGQWIGLDELRRELRDSSV